MKGEEWRKTKRLVTASFSVPRLKKTLPAMNECALKVKDQKFLKIFIKLFSACRVSLFTRGQGVCGWPRIL